MNLINQQYNGFSGSQDQHNFMSNFMIPTMVNILSQTKDILISIQDIQNVEDPNTTIVHQPLPTNPITLGSQIPWNWNDFFTYLSYTGLESCAVYPILFPSNSVSNSLFHQYVNIGHQTFH
jgi:hypothetical protein